MASPWFTSAILNNWGIFSGTMLGIYSRNLTNDQICHARFVRLIDMSHCLPHRHYTYTKPHTISYILSESFRPINPQRRGHLCSAAPSTSKSRSPRPTAPGAAATPAQSHTGRWRPGAKTTTPWCHEMGLRLDVTAKWCQMLCNWVIITLLLPYVTSDVSGYSPVTNDLANSGNTQVGGRLCLRKFTFDVF